MEPAEFGLDAWPHVDLGCAGRADPHAHVRAVTSAMLPHLGDLPDLLIVQGDTSSALGGALAGFQLSVPVAHVEAGLRTHDPRLPWPEEDYRTAIDRGAELLFAPTETSAANLSAEEVSGEIFVTGNTAVDAVLEAASNFPSSILRDGGRPRLLVTCHRRESWPSGLRSIASAIIQLTELAEVEFIVHPNPFVADQMVGLLAGTPVSLVKACSHRELLLRMLGADVVLSDSGGIQEEAPTLGVPLLILRDKTERPECVEAGGAILVGTDAGRIVSETQRLLTDTATRLAMSAPRFPFGDGKAGERIAAVIGDWLEQRTLTRRLA